MGLMKGNLLGPRAVPLLLQLDFHQSYSYYCLWLLLDIFQVHMYFCMSYMKIPSSGRTSSFHCIKQFVGLKIEIDDWLHLHLIIRHIFFTDCIVQQNIYMHNTNRRRIELMAFDVIFHKFAFSHLSFVTHLINNFFYLIRSKKLKITFFLLKLDVCRKRVKDRDERKASRLR